NPAGQAIYTLSAISNGFSGPLALSLDGVEQIRGATGSLSQTSISSSGSSTLTVTTVPSTPPGIYPITAIANNGSLTHTVAFFLIVPSTSVHLSTMSAAFGNQRVGTKSSARTITMTNTGGSSLSISGFSLRGTNAPAFGQSNNCGSQLRAGKSCNIDITF